MLAESHDIIKHGNSNRSNIGFENYADFSDSYYSNDSEELSVFGQQHIFKVNCPPGHLGLIIQSTHVRGPVVKEVKPASPLLGVIIPGDVIIQIGKVITTEMTGHQVKHLIDNRSHHKHGKGYRLTVMRAPEI